MTRTELEKLAGQLMFKLSETEIDDLLKDFILWEKQFALLDELDMSQTEEMFYPQEREITYMREDVITDCLELPEVLLNAPQHKDDMIVVAKGSDR